MSIRPGALFLVMLAFSIDARANDDDDDSDGDSCSEDGDPSSDGDDDSDSDDPDWLDDGLVAYWPLDGDATDRSSAHNDGLMCGPTAVDGHSGPGSVALDFDGVDDYIDLAAAIPDVGSLGSGSISLWFRVDNAPDQIGNRPRPGFPGVPAIDQITYPALYMGAVDPVGGNHSLMVHPIHPGSRPTVWFTIVRNSKPPVPATPTTPAIGPTPPFFCFDSCYFPNVATTCDGRVPGEDLLAAGQWYHYVVTVDSTGNHGYLNGVELTDRRFNPDRSRFPIAQFPPGPGVPSEATDVEFFDDVLDQESFKLGAGVWGYATAERFMDGAIDEVRIYDRALTAAEVASLYTLTDSASGNSWQHLKYDTCTGDDYWWKDSLVQEDTAAHFAWENGWEEAWDQVCEDGDDEDDDWLEEHWW